MPWKAPSPLEIYKLLPRTNCKACGEANCMAFAVKLVNMEAKLEQCTPLVTEEKYRKNYEALKEILSPLVKEIEIKSPKRTVKIGGEYVMHRHELTYINPTAIAIDIDDSMSEEEIIKRVKLIESFYYEYLGRKLTLDLIAIRSVTNDPKKFAKAVTIVIENSSLPVILCSFNPKVIEAGLLASPGYRPLIYAATKDNWREMADLALKHEVPLAIFSPGDLDMLMSLAKTLTEYGVQDLALDPGTFMGKKGLSYTIKAFTQLRWKACNEGEKLAGFPLIGTPITAWKMVEGDNQTKAWWEMLIASMLITRYADLLILHSIDGWVLLPLVIWRFNIYTDPRRPVSVEPGLRIIGSPDEYSPVMVTGNYALTYTLVSQDIENAKISCYLLIIDTEGIAVEAAVPANKFTADKIAEALKNSGLSEKVKYKVLIIPGRAARLSGEIEDATGWKVLVGPLDSKDIGPFIKEWWRSEKLKELLES